MKAWPWILAFASLTPYVVAQQTAGIHGGNGVSLPAPPATSAVAVQDDYHGTTITDQYRWLEDAKSPETRAWIAAQNEYTASYLSQISIRPEIVKQLLALERIERYSVPLKRGNKYFYLKRLPEEDQFSIYLRDGLNGEERRIIDATSLSADHNTSVGILDVSQDGDILVYGVRTGGADEQQVNILNLKTMQVSAGELPPARYFGVQLSPSADGLYYSRFSHEGTTVSFHAITEKRDARIFGGEYRGEKLGEMSLIGVSVTDDGHYLLFDISQGVPAKREDILLKDLRHADSPIVPLVYGLEARFSVTEVNDSFYVLTDYHAPNGRIVKLAPGDSPENWKTILPEGKDVIQSAEVVGGRLFVSRLKDVRSETSIYTLNGKPSGQIPFPGIGSGSNVYGRPTDHEGFYTFQSFNLPPTIYRYDTTTGKSGIFARTTVPFVSDNYEVRQVFFASKDGTRIPMFIAGKKGFKLDGKSRLLMTAYGGFDVSLTPGWDPEYAWWIQQGGLFAQPNLRGGGEYGETWHKAGMFEKKQNVFDDFIGAAEFLIKNQYTSPARLAIRGRSNGGLLMGAALTQRPDLFGAIWCGYPLLDMLRYQNFLFGRQWTTEYGSAENAVDFKYILPYSPYQNVKAGTRYPAVMFFSGDADTRVDPLHARKMTPLVQAASASGRPVLLHYSIKGGHSSGVALKQLVDDQADELAFLWTETSEK
jgi:prolyl oligopeptidase